MWRLFRAAQLIVVLMLVVSLVGVLAGCDDLLGADDDNGNGSENGPDFYGDNEQLTAHLTYVNWEEGVAYTHLVKTILEDEMAYDVEIVAADVGPAYDSVAAGESDAFMEAWLPYLHADYMNEHGNNLYSVGTIHDAASTGLIVPQYMADQGITTISDLDDPDVFDSLNGEFTGIDPNARVMIMIAEQLIPAYGLDETAGTGYELVTNTSSEMMDALDAAVHAENNIVVIGWKPHVMFGDYDLHMLEQDGEAIFAVDDIRIVGRAGLGDDKPTLDQFLSNMFMTENEMGDLMVAIRESSLSTLEAAREWKEANAGVWEDWIPPRTDGSGSAE